MINSSFKAECQIAFIAISSLHSFSVHFSHHTPLTHLEDLKCRRKTLAHCPGSVPTIGVHRWWISALEEFILGQCPRHSINKVLRITETFQDSALWFKLFVNGKNMCLFPIKQINVCTSFTQKVNYNGGGSFKIILDYLQIYLQRYETRQVLFARFLSLSFLSVPQYDRGHFVSGAQSVETFDCNFSSQEKVYQLIGTVYLFQ